MPVATRRRKTKVEATPEERRAEMAKVLTHPMRLHVLRLLDTAESGKMSPKEIADFTETPLGTTAYHVRILVGAGFISPKGTRARRGAVEHFYAVNQRGRDLLKLVADW